MTGPFDQLVARLTKQAARLAEARLRQRTIPPELGWRRPALLWPLFTKG